MRPNCSSCHGALANSTKRGATASTIQTGIGSVGAMSSLSNLSTTQIQAIATALGRHRRGPTRTSVTYADTDPTPI